MDKYDKMVQFVYEQMKRGMNPSRTQFYDELEMYTTWAFDYSDKDKIKKAVERFKESRENESKKAASYRQEIPPHLKEIILSGSGCVQRIIEEKRNKGIKIDELALAVAYSECGETRKAARAKRLYYLKSKIKYNSGQ